MKQADEQREAMTDDEHDALMAAEDPRYPARKVAAEALYKHINEWINEYEFDNGEGGYHSPSEFERALIYDAFAGLTSDEDYQRLEAEWLALCGPTKEPPASDMADALRALLNSMSGTQEHDRAVGMAQRALAANEGTLTAGNQGGGALRPDHPLAKGSCLHGIGMTQHCAACAAEGAKHG